MNVNKCVLFSLFPIILFFISTTIFSSYDLRNEPYVGAQCDMTSYNITCCDGTPPPILEPYPQDCPAYKWLNHNISCYTVFFNVSTKPYLCNNTILNLIYNTDRLYDEGMTAQQYAEDNLNISNSCWFQNSNPNGTLTFNNVWNTLSKISLWKYMTLGSGSLCVLFVLLMIIVVIKNLNNGPEDINYNLLIEDEEYVS
jgi:hypothetical protein